MEGGGIGSKKEGPGIQRKKFNVLEAINNRERKEKVRKGTAR